MLASHERPTSDADHGLQSSPKIPRQSNDEATPALQGADRRSSEGFLDESIPALAISSLAAEAAARAARSSAARRASSASGGDGGEAGADDPRYPNGYSEDGVRAPDSNRRDILIGGPDHPGMAGRGRLDAVHGSAGARSASMEEKDNTDWIFDAPNVCGIFLSFWAFACVCVVDISVLFLAPRLLPHIRQQLKSRLRGLHFASLHEYTMLPLAGGFLFDVDDLCLFLCYLLG